MFPPVACAAIMYILQSAWPLYSTILNDMEIALYS